MKKKKTQSSKKNKKEQELPVEGQEINQVESTEVPNEESIEVEAPESAEDLSEGWDVPVEAINEDHAKMIQLHAELAQCQDQYLRLQAEFTNFRKRKEKEFSENLKFANAELLKTLLPILDNFDRTLDAIEKTDNLTAIKEGIGMVDQSMKRQLEKIGLSPIQEHQEFNVDLHEAISSVPVQEEEQKGKIIDVVEKGYVFKEKVIRFSKVVVGE